MIAIIQKNFQMGGLQLFLIKIFLQKGSRTTPHSR